MNLHIARTAITSKPPRQSLALTLYEVIAFLIAAVLLVIWA